jgi:ABC-2 type transport system ATP-binding protein
MADRDVAISVQHVNKTFRLPHEKAASIKNVVVNFYRRNKSYETQRVLNDVTFDVYKGEFFGIVGRNGSGKSTLLKLLAEIYTPDNGSITVNGRLTPFIELGVGFNPELTGRENVFLNGALLGFNRKEMVAMYDDIVAFAELEKFMDQKLKNYSSGMQVRLAFSIAIRAKSDILLIDEVLAVGDVTFQEKCFDVFRKIKKEGRTVVFVSHDLAGLQEFCDRCVLIDRGEQVDIGATEKIVMEYETRMAGGTTPIKAEAQSDRPGSGQYRMQKVEVRSVTGESAPTIKEGEPFSVLVKYKQHDSVEGLICGIGINDADNVSIMGPNTQESGLKLTEVDLGGKGVIEATFDTNALSPGVYTVTVGLFNGKGSSPYDFWSSAATFKVIGKARHGKITIQPTWSINKTSK